MNRVSTIERAFQLARSGECDSIESVQHQLEREDYTQVTLHLGGSLIRKQLRQAFARAKAEAAVVEATTEPADAQP